MIPIFSGKVENGKLKILGISKFNSYLLSLEGWVELTVRKRIENRSNKQNRYYWGVVIKILSDEMGLSQDETHEILKYQFLKSHVDITILGEIERTFFIRSTTSLNTKDMEIYLEEIRQWAASFLNCQVPMPNEVELLNP